MQVMGKTVDGRYKVLSAIHFFIICQLMLEKYILAKWTQCNESMAMKGIKDRHLQHKQNTE
jgi:hypothetical protein